MTHRGLMDCDHDIGVMMCPCLMQKAHSGSGTSIQMDVFLHRFEVIPRKAHSRSQPYLPHPVVQATVQLKHLFAKLHFPWLLDQWARFVATSASFRIFIFGQSLDENDDEMHNATRILSERLGQLSETQFNPERALQTPDSSGLAGRNTIVALYSCSLVVQNMLRSLLNAARHFQAFPNQN